MVQKRIRVAWRHPFRHHQWNIGVVDQPIHAFLRGGSHPPIRWFPLEGRRGFLADPFGQLDGSGATVICEHYDYRRARGTIAHIRLEGGRFASEPKPALELLVHLSYPCLVEEDGVVPEAIETRQVALFRADPFPTSWAKVGILVDDLAAIDPTIFRHDGRWWLACTDGDAEPDANLLLWHATTLEGPWTPHAANPVKTDVRSARPGGTPFVHEGRLYRPAQDCSRTYGGRIVVNEVIRLTPEEFLEEPVATIEPTADSPYPAGRHTLSALGDMTLIDGHRYVFVGVALRQFLGILGRDLAGKLRRARR